MLFVSCKCKFQRYLFRREVLNANTLRENGSKITEDIRRGRKTPGSPFIDQKVKYARLWQRGTKTGRSPCSLNLSWTPVITAWPNRNFLLDMTSSEEPWSGKPFLCNLKVLMTSKLGDSQYSLRSITFSRIVVSFPFFLSVSFLSFNAHRSHFALETYSTPPPASLSHRTAFSIHKTCAIVNHRYNFISAKY